MNRQRPQDLVFTLFGEYLLPRAGPVWAGTLIDLLEPLGASEGAVRTTLSRMSRKGWFDTVRAGRRSFYQLTRRGRALLEEGRERIYHPSWDEPWDGRWLLLAYSIPEDRRELRDRLRDRVGWLGFGALGNGLWISPHDVEGQVRDIASDLGIEEHLECFHAEGAGFTEPDRLVSRCWDLESLNRRYEGFIARHVPSFLELRQPTEPGVASPRDCYVRRFQLSHEFREFPLIDPYLPRSLLPPDWAGECAAALFQSYHDLLTDPADRYVESLLAMGGTPAGRVAPTSKVATGRGSRAAQRRLAR
jgi:phenylacetic acid degradation operon negative regulatory protein